VVKCKVVPVYTMKTFRGSMVTTANANTNASVTSTENRGD
jgi:hypothetical protein